jgi:hypothetical protein
MRRLLAVVVMIGLALRAVQYLADSSLWLDEVALAKNVLELDVRDLLTEPLPYDQVAPGGFLLAQKAATLALGQSDRVLRLIPFASSALALLVYASFARRVLAPTAAFVATLLFATAAPLIVFAGTVKQYSTDVCAAVVLSWIALDLITREVSERRAWCAAFAGAVLQWCSYSAVFVIAGLLLPVALWTSASPPESRQRRVGIVVGMWAVSAVAITIWSLATTSAETLDYMRLYWADGLAPLSVQDWIRSGWPWPAIYRLFRGGVGAQAGLAYPLAPLYVVLTIAGLSLLWRRDKRTTVILLAPIAVTLAAAAARQYPFRDRLILFLLPAVVTGIGEAAAAAARALRAFSPRLAPPAVIAVSVLAVWPVATKPPPYRVEDVKQVLGYVQARRQPSDEVYVYYASAPVVSVYDAAFGFARGAYAVGGCHRGNSRRYFEELDTFRGRPRVWVIVTHSLPGYREREDIVAYLDAIGTRADDVNVPSRAISGEPLPAEGFLYDLSATGRLARADAASFAVTGPSGTNQQNTCVNGPHTMIPSDFVCAERPVARCVRRY